MLHIAIEYVVPLHEVVHIQAVDQIAYDIHSISEGRQIKKVIIK